MADGREEAARASGDMVSMVVSARWRGLSARWGLSVAGKTTAEKSPRLLRSSARENV